MRLIRRLYDCFIFLSFIIERIKPLLRIKSKSKITRWKLSASGSYSCSGFSNLLIFHASCFIPLFSQIQENEKENSNKEGSKIHYWTQSIPSYYIFLPQQFPITSQSSTPLVSFLYFYFMTFKKSMFVCCYTYMSSISSHMLQSNLRQFSWST